MNFTTKHNFELNMLGMKLIIKFNSYDRGDIGLCIILYHWIIQYEHNNDNNYR